MRQVVTYKKWSSMRGSNWKALTVFWIGGRLRHVVAYGGWLYHNTLHSSVLSLSKIYCLYRLDQGLQPSHQKGSIHSPTDDGMRPPPPKLLRMITSFIGSTSDPFQINSWVKQGCVLASTLFRMFSSYCCLTPSARKNKWCVPSHHKRWKPCTSPSKH